MSSFSCHLFCVSDFLQLRNNVKDFGCFDDSTNIFSTNHKKIVKEFSDKEKFFPRLGLKLLYVNKDVDFL